LLAALASDQASDRAETSLEQREEALVLGSGPAFLLGETERVNPEA
jgi:hypothetical protein